MENINQQNEFISITEHLVMGKDLNIAGTLFGGNMMAWIDEAAAMYAMTIMKTKLIVTRVISQIEFKKPVKLGDYLSFCCGIDKIGKSSLTVSVKVYINEFIKKPEIKETIINKILVVSASVTFVSVDEAGKKKEWH